jgi:two-component system cell cycle response regulator/two-component system cell cycle response regulator DivK
MVQLMRDAGFETYQADDGEEVLEIVHSQPLDLILMDIRMPVIDGLTAARTIRENDEYSNIKIIAVSATVLPEMQSEITRCGCDAFIGKPVDTRILFAEIEKQLGIVMTATAADSDEPGDTETLRAGFDIGAADRQQIIDLLQQIASAASFGDIAAVRARIAHLQQQVPTDNLVLVQLQHMSDRFEMEAIARLVQLTLEKLQESKV